MANKLWILAAIACGLLGCSSTDEEEPVPQTAQPILQSGLAGFANLHAIGDVLIGSQPSPEGLANARDDGATIVLNTRPSSEMSFDERQVVEALGMRYMTIPFVPNTLTDSQVVQFIDVMDDREGKVLLHCSSGNRVSALWAMYEITRLGVGPEDAVARARQTGLRSPELIGYIGDYARRIGAW